MYTFVDTFSLCIPLWVRSLCFNLSGLVVFVFTCGSFSLCKPLWVGSLLVYLCEGSVCVYLCGYVLFGGTVRPVVVLFKTEQLFDGVVVDGDLVIHGTHCLPYVTFTCRMLSEA